MNISLKATKKKHDANGMAVLINSIEKKKKRRDTAPRRASARPAKPQTEAAIKTRKLEKSVDRLKAKISMLKAQLVKATAKIESLEKRIENQSYVLQRKKDQHDLLFPNIPDLILEADADETVNFAVEAAAHYEDPAWAVVRYTDNLDSAYELFDLLAPKHGCVRLSERGTWVTGSYKKKVDFVTFWWSDKDYVGESPKRRGYGIPNGGKRCVEYTPLRP